MKEKLKFYLRSIRKNIIEYIATNRLFLIYIILAMVGLTLVRGFTIGKIFSF